MKHTRHMDLEKASNLKLPWPDYFLSGVSGQQIASGYLWIRWIVQSASGVERDIKMDSPARHLYSMSFKMCTS